MKEPNSYFTLVYFIGVKLYSVKANNRREAAEKGMENIINDKYRRGKFLQYNDFPILIAVQENPKSNGFLSLYRTEIQGKEERIKEVKKLEEVEPFLRSAFRAIRDDIKDIKEFKKIIEILIKKMIEETASERRQEKFFL